MFWDVFNILALLFAGFLISLAASIILEVPRNLFLKNGIIGIIAEAVFILTNLKFNAAISVLAASIVVTLISQVAARLYRAPVTVFYIPVFFIFVPGAALYKIAYYLIQSQQNQTIDSLFEALTISGAVALGVFFGDSFLEIMTTLRNKRKNKNEELES